LSGNPVAMAAGVATINKLREKGTYKRLNELTQSLIEGLHKILKKLGIKAQINSVGSMFTLFFTDRQVIDYESALNSDTKMYSRFFKNLLSAGIMFPPSQFEAVFLSLAHTEREINITLRACYKALKETASGG
ncbi:MAG TPA: aminotransferase class III-fold pyridoxal phosphate-dependent enzyme, partial [Thermodesulfobacteriota bacterium]|nr:aminotransferase class III-fold pyridoxal phosphate-dependent enzyme [Thermodesulfobacteriota bacterium]